MKKNILIFGHGYATQFVDINNLYTQLFDKNHYIVTVVYLTGKPSEEIKKQHTADEVIFLNSTPKSTRGLKIEAIKRMLELQRKKKFQLVICHRYKPSYIMMWVARFYSISALFCVMHELKTLHPLSRKLSVLCLAKKNTVFAGVSNAVRDDIRSDIRWVPPGRIITLYNTIDLAWIESQWIAREEARQSLNIPPQNFIFGTIGRLAKAKDQQTLLRAFALIKSQCINAQLIIVGDGELEIDLKTLCKELGIEKELLFTGFIPHAFKLMKAFDLFILPSIREAFGRVLLEAMAAKVPIIAAASNGIPEVIGNKDFLVEPGNSVKLAEKMLEMYRISQEIRNSWSEKNYQRVKKEFSLHRFNEIFWELPWVQEIQHKESL